MDQQRLAQRVLSNLHGTSEKPTTGRYLSFEDAEKIVDETIQAVSRDGDAVTQKYLKGHRYRLILNLTMIPHAQSDRASCLDVGSFGYMAFWVSRYLGYSAVEGVELRPDLQGDQRRIIEVGRNRLELVVRNFDISQPEWPIQQQFDVILFFETLEHVNADPAGVMINIAKLMTLDSLLVMSVPNAVSYKTLEEFMTGMPPWTYWFFHPDLKHEPRHCFEYTPFIVKALLYGAGFIDITFRTICAYEDRNSLDDVFAIGGHLSVDPRFFGETIIIQARKVSDTPPVRYPDCIYNGASYYNTTFPALLPQRRKAIKRFLAKFTDRDRQIDALQANFAAADEARRHADAQMSIAEAARAQVEAQISIVEVARARAEAQSSIAEAARARAEAQSSIAEAARARAEAQTSDALYACEMSLTRYAQLKASFDKRSLRYQLFELLRRTARPIIESIRPVLANYPRLKAVLRPAWRFTRKIARIGLN